ncbi:MAG: signal peptidase I [Planctomycetales bacterium]|nr:signal peptidase I [Planctomycetales bacterium]
MAIILALLFRGFVAEAFVIPTGSMAPTLMGRHKDVKCPECGQWYKTGASNEWNQETNLPTGRFVTTTTCPVCRYTQRLDLFKKPNDRSFSGDRIIVSKFAYEIGEPERWDVIVFKYPGAATINYIKRLIGLPGETIRIEGGNIWTKKKDDKDFQIARKPAGRLNSMLQLVDDTDHIPQRLTDVGWPRRWQEWPAAKGDPSWQTDNGGKSYTIEAKDKEVWLRYRHIVPSHEDWQQIMEGKLPADSMKRRGSLVTDFAAYNVPHSIAQNNGTPISANLLPGTYSKEQYDPTLPGPGESPDSEPSGIHWADDLVVDCLAKIESSEGELTLDIVQAGVHHKCRINLADGVATLTMTNPKGDSIPFDSADNNAVKRSPTAQTAVKGPGSYRLRLSNVDRLVQLWVNGSVVEFDSPTTYDCNANLIPYWTPEDPLDLAPAGIAAKGCKVQVSSLKIHRDIYYIAVENPYGATGDYDQFPPPNLYSEPEMWASYESLFTNRRSVEFPLKENQFFPMGDNSSHSSDARIWDAEEHFVHRDLLIGRAMFVYWPHTWNSPIWNAPNPGEMRRIR